MIVIFKFNSVHFYVKVIFLFSGWPPFYLKMQENEGHFQRYLMANFSHTLNVLVGVATASAVLTREPVCLRKLPPSLDVRRYSLSTSYPVCSPATECTSIMCIHEVKPNTPTISQVRSLLSPGLRAPPTWGWFYTLEVSLQNQSWVFQFFCYKDYFQFNYKISFPSHISSRAKKG